MTDVKVDVLVVGAGSAGCAAAITAGRAAASTLIVDRLPFVGGTSTATLDTFYAFFTPGEHPLRVVGGIGWEIAQLLLDRGAAFLRPNSFGSGLGVTYQPEALKAVWDQELQRAGVRVWTGGIVVAAEENDDGVKVTVATKGALRTVIARSVIDASGDGDAVIRAGGSTLTDDELTQPATMTFQLANVDFDLAFPAEGRRPLKEYIEEARAEGYELAGVSGSLHKTPAQGIVHVAMTRVTSPDPDDPDSWRAAETLARQQVDTCVQFLRDRVPGFADAVLTTTSPALGVRETRRIHGVHVLTEEEILEPRLSDDAIALCGAPIEDLAPAITRWVHIPEPGYYGIPFGCLKPVGLSRFLVAGRCLSATHAAHSSARSMATCMAMGQAAGVAAAIAAKRTITASRVQASEVRTRLTSDGALLVPLRHPESVR